MKNVTEPVLSPCASQHAPKSKMLELFDDLLSHDGFGEFRVEIKILKRKQKEVIIHSGKQFRYIVDMDNNRVTRANSGDGGSR